MMRRLFFFLFLQIHFLSLFSNGLVGKLSSFSILLRFRVLDLPNEPLHAVSSAFDVEFSLCSPIIIKIELDGECAVLALHEVIDIVVGIEHVLSDFLIGQFHIGDHSNSKGKILGWVIANGNEV